MSTVKTEIAEIITQINHLLIRNIDAEKGYAEAIGKVSDPELKSFMVSQAKQRATFIEELTEMVRTIGGVPNTDTSLGSDVHRMWMDLRSIFSQNINPAHTNQIIKEECLRGEKAAIKEYNKVLEVTNLAPSARKLLQQQQDRIMAAYQFLEHFE